MGEAMRRYWHPIAISSTLTSDRPHRTRLLGEDLIVFRDGNGQAGVVFERCAHRGTSLYFGRIEDDGIRCCYHGMKFDTQGHCLEQACEPERGRRRDAIRQPWYPVEERYGLVFVYMGPPERKPTLPRYDFFEPLEQGDVYVTELPIPGAEVVGAVSEWNWCRGAALAGENDPRRSCSTDPAASEADRADNDERQPKRQQEPEQRPGPRRVLHRLRIQGLVGVGLELAKGCSNGSQPK